MAPRTDTRRKNTQTATSARVDALEAQGNALRAALQALSARVGVLEDTLDGLTAASDPPEDGVGMAHVRRGGDPDG